MDYISLAKQAVENYIKTGEIIKPSKDSPKEFFDKRAGVFVTIEKGNELRGCVGTCLPTKGNLAEEIICSAIAACSEDSRFNSINEKELLELSYTVYVLGEQKLVENIKELNSKKFGIIVKSIPSTTPTGIDVALTGPVRFKSGLLLPDLDGVDTVEQQISIACQKAGINPLKEKIIIYKFTAEKYK